MPSTLPSPAQRMEVYVLNFLNADSYDLRHIMVIGMSKLPDRENIEINLPPHKITHFFLKMQAFGWQHGRKHPDCTCMN